VPAPRTTESDEATDADRSVDTVVPIVDCVPDSDDDAA